MYLDPYVARLFQIESGGNPYAVTGSNRGLGQFGPQEEAQYGITPQNRYDPQVQANAVQQEQNAQTSALTKALGRAPTPGEFYLTHQQGIAGGPALLTGGDTPAWQAIRPYYRSDAIAKQAISGNLPRGSGIDPATATASQFARFWVNKFESGMPGGGLPNNAPQANSAPFQAIPSATAPSLPLFAGGPAAAPNTQQPASFNGAPGASLFGGMAGALGNMAGQQQQPGPPPIMPFRPMPPDLSQLQAFLASQGRT